MKIRRSSWDKWAPVAYLFVIGLSVGFGLGFAFERIDGSYNPVYFALIPVMVILVAFVSFVIISRRMTVA